MSDIQAYLESLKQAGFWAPAGIHWDRFRKVLVRASKIDDDDELPNPLIFGGSIASHAQKHERLRSQLAWAEKHQCLQEALDYLRRLPEESWNRSNGTNWDEEHPWTREER